MSNRIVGLVIGAIYVVVGALGFVMDPVLGLVTTSLLGNLLHLAIGAALVATALLGWSKLANSIVGTLLLVVGLTGLFTISTDANPLGVNGAANLLHFASSAALLLVGLGAKK